MKSIIPCVLALAGPCFAQQSNQQPQNPAQQQQNPAQQQQNQPANPQQSSPLFKGKLGYKSSSTSKESTTLGFNGIDPSGKVDKKMMATAPTGSDQQKVKEMSANQPSAADLKVFVKGGGLNSK